jgi:two-component sensor histidine kinase
VSAFLGIEAAHTTNSEAREIIDRARSRIQGIATTQRRLHLEDDLESANAQLTLMEVINDLISMSIHNNDAKLVLDIASLSLAPRDITSLAIILSELVTNALKYAYTEGANARLTISLQELGKGVTLTVIDNGSGFDTADLGGTASGLGRTIIDRLARQYGGNAVWMSKGGIGTTVEVSLPKMAVRGRETVVSA